MNRTVLEGILRGFLSWLTYATVEFALCSVYPLVTRPNTTLASWHWSLTGMLLLCYSALGVVLGAVAGLLLRRSPKGVTLLGSIVPLSVAVIFIAHQLVERPSFAFLGTGAAIVVAFLAAGATVLPSLLWRERLKPLTSPWTLSIALLAPFWVHAELLASRSERVRVLGGIAAQIAVLGLAIATRWFVRPLPIKTAERLAPAAYRFAAIAITLLALAVFFNRGLPPIGSGPKQQSAISRPNVVLITMDTVRAENLSVYGYSRKTTPALDNLAAGSNLFRRAIATSDMTLSTHASLFTGVYSSWHGTHYDAQSPTGYPLSKDYTTLAEQLSSTGYRCMALAANSSYVSSAFGLDRGFHVFDSRAPVLFLHGEERSHRYFLRWGIRRMVNRFQPTASWEAVTRTAGEINADATKWLDAARAAGTPFFLFLNYMDAHTPYIPPPPFDTMFPGRLSTFTYSDHIALRSGTMNGVRQITSTERDHLRSQYDGGIAYLDSQIGDLVAHLKQADLYDNTLLIVTADHGEALGEKNLVEYSVTSIYQHHIHVPLIVKYPRQTAARVIDDVVTQVDVMPTVLEVAGIRRPPGLQGISLNNAAREVRHVMSECFSGPKFKVKRAVIQWPLKWIAWQDGRRELYDLSTDPTETREIHTDRPQESIELEAILSKWKQDIPARRATRSSKLDDETLRRLKSLGYVQ